MSDCAEELRGTQCALYAIARNGGRSLNRGFMVGTALLSISALLVARFQSWVAFAIVGHTQPLAFLSGAFLNLVPLIPTAVVVITIVVSLAQFDWRDYGRALSGLSWAAAGALGKAVLVGQSPVRLVPIVWGAVLCVAAGALWCGGEGVKQPDREGSMTMGQAS